jgi:hypothetical protein
MEEALKLAPASEAEALRHLRLLGLVRSGGELPDEVDRAMEQQQNMRLLALSSRGCTSPWQQPQECVAGLQTRAWHEPVEHGPRALRVAALLHAAAPELRSEYKALRRSRKLMREQAHKVKIK